MLLQIGERVDAPVQEAVFGLGGDLDRVAQFAVFTQRLRVASRCEKAVGGVEMDVGVRACTSLWRRF